MSPIAFIFMILFLILMWGGLIYTLRLAIKKESKKNNLFI